MLPERCAIVCFSPTGSTRKLAEAVARGAGLATITHDCTLPGQRRVPAALGPDDLVILAAPVYFGRVQEHAAACFAGLTGQGQPTILLVNYGNRHYDDALLELSTISRDRGFIPIAAAAFVSEHSFSTADCPLSPGRPDPADLDAAVNFGKRATQSLEQAPRQVLSVPGNFPYKPYPDFHRAPVSSQNCGMCGACVEVCPTAAITLQETVVVTDESRCIVCQACVRNCPEGARSDVAPGAVETRQLLIPLVAEGKESHYLL